MSPRIPLDEQIGWVRGVMGRTLSELKAAHLADEATEKRWLEVGKTVERTLRMLEKHADVVRAAIAKAEADEKAGAAK